MMLFNLILLSQLKQNSLLFDVLTNLILLLLVYLVSIISLSSMTERLNFYLKQHTHLLKPLFDCLLSCSITKVTCNIIINNLGHHLKVFMLLTVYILLCVTNKFFVDVAYEHLISGEYQYLPNVFIGQDGDFCSVKIF